MSRSKFHNNKSVHQKIALFSVSTSKGRGHFLCSFFCQISKGDSSSTSKTNSLPGRIGSQLGWICLLSPEILLIFSPYSTIYTQWYKPISAHAFSNLTYGVVLSQTNLNLIKFIEKSINIYYIKLVTLGLPWNMFL